MTTLDWPALMRLGVGRLRLPPAEFWRLTPIEFLLLIGRQSSAAPTTRETLDQLVRTFPDKRKNT